MKYAVAFVLVMSLSAGFLSCSQQLGVPPASPEMAQDFFWQPAQLARGIDYYVVRNNAGSDHLLSSSDGHHIEDGALSNEVTMITTSGQDSVLIDSLGENSIFSLPNGYHFGYDSVADTTLIPVSQSLILLNRSQLDSGGSWQAGMLFGPGLQNGVPIIASVLDLDDSLRLPPVSAGADSAFGESFRIRYAPQNDTDSLSRFPVYWIAYYSRGVGPILIQQYMLGKIMDSVQIIGAR